MLKNLKSAWSKSIPLFVNSEPEEKVKPYTRMNRETGEEESAEFIQNTLNGTILTDEFGPGVYQKLKVNIDSRNTSITPTQVLKTFYRHQADLVSGKKHILAQVSMNPRGDKDGASVLIPELQGIEVVESKEEDLNFIKGMTVNTSQVV